MKQLIESFIDVGSGFILAILIQLYIFPFFNLYPTVWDSIGIALIFTIVSITRSWLWRLAFIKNGKKERQDISQAEWIKGYKEWKKQGWYK
jgi:hypothetical protein|tara:strand:- start:501 stop:773 length:273 start_codon:yes stop_codon:yes gene_type:complete